MKEIAICSLVTTTLFPKLTNSFAFPLWFGRTRTISRATSRLTGLLTFVSWLRGFMLVNTIVFATAPFIPCHAVPLGNEARLALDCGSGGSTGTRKTFG